MPICADRKDYKNAFKKHYHTYKQHRGTESNISHRLILIYCVECGLKYMLMEKERIYKVDEAQDITKRFLNSHDYYKLLNSLNQAGSYSFPPIKTVHNDMVRADTYHQLCRYAIRAVKDDEGLIAQYDNQLQQIADWLGEHVI